MNQFTLSLLAFIGGIFLAIQGGYNSQLGVMLKNPLLASLSAFFSSTIFALLFVLLSLRKFPVNSLADSIPWYLWFIGGLFSVMGITLYYITIPKLGVSTMISLGLCGQLTFAVIAGHFGWFNLPVETISWMRILGVMALVIGILLINLKP